MIYICILITSNKNLSSYVQMKKIYEQVKLTAQNFFFTLVLSILYVGTATHGISISLPKTYLNFIKIYPSCLFQIYPTSAHSPSQSH